MRRWTERRTCWKWKFIWTTFHWGGRATRLMWMRKNGKEREIRSEIDTIISTFLTFVVVRCCADDFRGNILLCLPDTIKTSPILRLVWRTADIQLKISFSHIIYIVLSLCTGFSIYTSFRLTQSSTKFFLLERSLKNFLRSQQRISSDKSDKSD